MDKFDITRSVLRSIPQEFGRSVLDVGCRNCIFKTHLGEEWDYSGLDLFQNERGTVDYVQSVEAGIPIQDRAFTGVVALDVVEHVDKISQVMDELWRVTDRKLVVALPNMAFFLYRIHFLYSGNLGEKYRILPYGQDDGDRHRWLTTARESIRYMTEFCNAKGPEAKLSWLATAESLGRKLFSKALGAVGISEQVYAPTLVFVIERTS